MELSSIYKNQSIAKPKNSEFGSISENIFESIILIVDDDQLHCHMISIILKQYGFNDLHFANDGHEALQKACDLKPDLIILDILMPNIDGMEICRQLREMSQFRNTPIIAHTIQHEPEERAEIYDAGVTDIFSKPVSEREVQNRVYMHLEYARMVEGLKQNYLRLTRDLEIARTMQDALMPELSQLANIQKSHKINIESRYESSNELGGDFWGVDIVDADRIFIYIVDFSGHGISASINTFRIHSLISNYKNPAGKNSTPAEYLEKLNRDLFKLLPIEQYATMLCGFVDIKRDRFTYAAAASTAPLKLTLGTRELTCLDPSGFPLGMIEDATYENREVSFEKDEMLFLYSDVLTESQIQKGRMIGHEYFQKICQETSVNVSPDQTFLNRLLKSFNMLVIRPLRDDLTAVTLKRL